MATSMCPPITGATSLPPALLHCAWGPDHKAIQTEHFGTIDQGTGIRFYKGALYAASGTGIYRFSFDSDALVPTAAPELIVDGLVASNHPIAFDGRGNLFVSLDGGGNICADPNTPKGGKPVGLKPCPNLETRGGIWRFDASKPQQKFGDGERYATGIRNSSALDWRDGDTLYSAMHGRDGTHAAFPDLVSASDDGAIADEMFRVTKGTDMGWPYTYYDGARKLRLVGPEYGGDGKTSPTDGNYATPVAAFQPLRPAVLDLAFYKGNRFPRMYRGGAFLAMHGGEGAPLPEGHAGYTVIFVPFNGNRAGDADRVCRRLCRTCAGRQERQHRGLSAGWRCGGSGRRALCGGLQQRQNLADCLWRVAARPLASGTRPRNASSVRHGSPGSPPSMRSCRHRKQTASPPRRP